MGTANFRIASASRALLVWLILGAATTVVGCSTPLTRSHDRAAAFQKLSPAARQLVLRGHVRKGMNEDAVYIAWGAPDWKSTLGAGKDGTETWTYVAELGVYAPMGSYDQSTAFGFFGPDDSPWMEPGFGIGGSQYEGILDQPHVIPTFSRRKMARFVDGELVSFVSLRYGHAVPADSMP